MSQWRHIIVLDNKHLKRSTSIPIVRSWWNDGVFIHLWCLNKYLENSHDLLFKEANMIFKKENIYTLYDSENQFIIFIFHSSQIWRLVMSLLLVILFKMNVLHKIQDFFFCLKNKKTISQKTLYQNKTNQQSWQQI